MSVKTRNLQSFDQFLRAFTKEILREETDKEAAHLEKLNDCKKAIHAVLSKHGCKLTGTRFGVLVASTSGAKRRIKL